MPLCSLPLSSEGALRRYVEERWNGRQTVLPGPLTSAPSLPGSRLMTMATGIVNNESKVIMSAFAGV